MQSYADYMRSQQEARAQQAQAQQTLAQPTQSQPVQWQEKTPQNQPASFTQQPFQQQQMQQPQLMTDPVQQREQRLYQQAQLERLHSPLSERRSLMVHDYDQQYAQLLQDMERRADEGRKSARAQRMEANRAAYSMPPSLPTEPAAPKKDASGPRRWLKFASYPEDVISHLQSLSAAFETHVSNTEQVWAIASIEDKYFRGTMRVVRQHYRRVDGIWHRKTAETDELAQGFSQIFISPVNQTLGNHVTQTGIGQLNPTMINTAPQGNLMTQSIPPPMGQMSKSVPPVKTGMRKAQGTKPKRAKSAQGKPTDSFRLVE